MDAKSCSDKKELGVSKSVGTKYKYKPHKETFELNRIQIDDEMFNIHKGKSPRGQLYCTTARKNRSPSLNIEIAESEPFVTKSSPMGNLLHGLGTGSARNNDRNKFKDFSKVMKGISLNKTFNTIRRESLGTKTSKVKQTPTNPSAGNNININILINGDKSKSSRVNKRQISMEKMKSLGGNSGKDEIDNQKSHAMVFDSIMKRLDDSKSRKSPQTGWFDKPKTTLQLVKKHLKIH